MERLSGGILDSNSKSSLFDCDKVVPSIAHQESLKLGNCVLEPNDPVALQRYDGVLNPDSTGERPPPPMLGEGSARRSV